MNCREIDEVLDGFLNGSVSGEKSRAIRRHLAICPLCASRLSEVDKVEILPALDEAIEPSAGFGARVRAGLQWRNSAPVASTSRKPVIGIDLLLRGPWRLAAIGGLAALLALGIFVRYSGDDRESPLNLQDIAVAENIGLLKDLDMIVNLDLLENFEEIERLTPDSGAMLKEGKSR